MSGEMIWTGVIEGQRVDVYQNHGNRARHQVVFERRVDWSAAVMHLARRVRELEEAVGDLKSELEGWRFSGG